jgi:hypothetical protein
VNLRLSGTEVRVRVDRQEAEALARGEALEQEIAFPGNAVFQYRVEPSADRIEPAASLNGTMLAIRVSSGAVRDLLAARPSKDAGLSAPLPTGPGRVLQLKVEIDLFSEGKGPRRK